MKYFIVLLLSTIASASFANNISREEALERIHALKVYKDEVKPWLVTIDNGSEQPAGQNCRLSFFSNGDARLSVGDQLSVGVYVDAPEYAGSWAGNVLEVKSGFVNELAYLVRSEMRFSFNVNGDALESVATSKTLWKKKNLGTVTKPNFQWVKVEGPIRLECWTRK